MQGDSAIVLQPAMEDEMEEEKKNLSMETSKRIRQWGYGGGTCVPRGVCGRVQQVAGVPAKGGRETVLSWPVVLVACAGKEGKKIREVSQGGNGSNSNTLFAPKLQVAHFHMPQIRRPIVQVNCYAYART